MTNLDSIDELKQPGLASPHSAFLNHTKCPPAATERIVCAPESGKEGFFKLGSLRLFGRTGDARAALGPGEALPAIDSRITRNSKSVHLPINPTEIIENLRWEKYAGSANTQISYITNGKSFSRRLYYAIRPLLPVNVRRHLQRRALQDWSKISFPEWPVDTTVENFIDLLWRLILEANGEEQIPFIWYWPDSASSCAIMTHDVETGVGQDFCPTLLKLEKEHGIKSAFELVPEVRYPVSQKVMEAIREAGSEVCVHGLNHDGRLFSSEDLFRSRAKAINQYAKQWGAKGFRSPVMYRNLEWYDAFHFSYDMSVPNVAHLDPQRGGCCTVFPYFVGNILELPLTTTQDYSLFNIIRTDAMEMWSRQMDLIMAKHGLVSFIIHPDYVTEPKEQALYGELLGTLRTHHLKRNMWLALPSEVDTWWRERAAMTLTEENGKWRIRGKGSERAGIAYARLENGKVNYALPNEN
jgi:peptidoglycan/xylan/chitin deacetylase (PgdA/CDA1 family)